MGCLGRHELHEICPLFHGDLDCRDGGQAQTQIFEEINTDVQGGAPNATEKLIPHGESILDIYLEPHALRKIGTAVGENAVVKWVLEQDGGKFPSRDILVPILWIYTRTFNHNANQALQETDQIGFLQLYELVLRILYLLVIATLRGL